jgi:hypothetical protein
MDTDRARYGTYCVAQFRGAMEAEGPCSARLRIKTCNLDDTTTCPMLKDEHGADEGASYDVLSPMSYKRNNLPIHDVCRMIWRSQQSVTTVGAGLLLRNTFGKPHRLLCHSSSRSRNSRILQGCSCFMPENRTDSQGLRYQLTRNNEIL